MISLNNDWEFARTWSEAFAAGEGPGEAVRLPHNVGDLPLHYCDPADYTGICGYRRTLEIPEEYRGRRLFLQFDGAAHIATVYVNGTEAAAHRSGYTAFRAEITDLVEYGSANRLAVRLDTTENGAVPPFGFMVDYLTFGGLYREVWLDVRGTSYIEDIFVTTPKMRSAEIELTIEGEYDGLSLTVTGRDGEVLSEVFGSGRSFGKGGAENVPDAETGAPEPKTNGKRHFRLHAEQAKLWMPESPELYWCTASLTKGGEVIDTKTVRFGFRTIRFRQDGVYVNGKKIFLRGLNRHQCYPYLGYAAPAPLQREDARILKEELACTAVRTSHYPQSQSFIDACDELGLLVFTEIPGWQHIGDEAWQEQACENVKEMVLQYRNHPSIVLWGVRINESPDNDVLYRRTNAIAHELDPSRPTSGVRFLEQSSLLEDVYAFNDFSHNGTNPGCRPKKAVTPDMEKPLLISEHSGHMFPTKPYDPWEKRQEHALRHVRVQDAAAADGEHAGCFGWCMFDYQTHKDFGSGDRVCYHGVLDLFRNPKLAAAAYASQGEEKPFIEVGCPMDIGDYAGGQTGDVYIFTNADEVDLYKNDHYVATFRGSEWSALPHGPMKVTDTIGQLLVTEEGMSEAQAKLIRKCLLSAAKHGLSNLPPADRLRMARAMAQYGFTYKEADRLYGKYVGNWGGEATVWRFDAKKDGRVTASTTKAPARLLQIEAKASSRELREGDTYDMALVRVRILDENGNVASYAQLPVRFTVEGAAELAGPETAAAEGGMCGTYVRTCGKTGEAVLTVEAPGCERVRIRFAVR